MVECGPKTEEEVKAMKSEIKKNIQGTNSEGKETRTQINSLQQKKETSNQENKEKFRKMRRGLGTSRTSLNIPTSES